MLCMFRVNLEDATVLEILKLLFLSSASTLDEETEEYCSLSFDSLVTFSLHISAYVAF